MAFKAYLAELQNNLRSGHATEATYYSALRQLLEGLDPKVEVFCEPKHIEVGHPDFRVQRRGQAIEAALRIAHAAHLDIGGIEYLVNARDSEIYFYDINALSNFVTDAPRLVGFDPFKRFVDLILSRLHQEAFRK